jgi:hypothetical protein
MPVIDYSKPQNFCDSAEAVSVMLSSALVQLRDHAAFQDEPDISILHAAALLSSVLEDAKAEVEHLLERLEATAV